jgi:hypothetical protein
VNQKLIPILTLLLLLVSISYSQTRPRESLRGLNGVYVCVQPVGKDVAAGGLSTSNVQTAVETQFREASIPLHSEPQPADGSANLAIIINTIKHPQGAYLYDVAVSLLQEVHLARSQEPDPFPAPTWSPKAMGLSSANRMDLVLEPLRARLVDFIKDYVSVNPKPHR